MKLFLAILIYLLSACNTHQETPPKNILDRTKFEDILKEVHLAEAAFELRRTEGIQKAKNQLANSYKSIYLKHEISNEEFNTTLNYYSNHADKLEEIYFNILEKVNKEKASFDQQ